MTNFDDYFTGDEVVKLRAYKEFELSKTDKENLESIEKSLAAKKLNSGNSTDSLEYLETMFYKISQIKNNEREFEGENNLNVNMYLERIRNLIAKIKQL